MGIPKFFRWLVTKYPDINQPCADKDIPNVDNLYLDMNGIVYVNLAPSEEETMMKIFEYLDVLVQKARPKKVIFIAIDGVAAQAKMNEQRSRRFKCAKEMTDVIGICRLKKAGDKEESSKRTDITPGTRFMTSLAGHLKFFFKKKLAEDCAWQTPEVIFSGHDVPGEGEHKIMDYIRWIKSRPGYKANQRHLLDGTDSDLILLALVTHEPHFCILRVTSSPPEPLRRDLLHIGILRACLMRDLSPLVSTDKIDKEKLLDDFVVMCSFLGNDFLPVLPTLDVHEGALDELLSIYRRLLPGWKGHLVADGHIHKERLEALLNGLAFLEKGMLVKRAAVAEAYERRQKERSAYGSAGQAQTIASLMSKPFRTELGHGLQAWKDLHYLKQLKIYPSAANIRNVVRAYMEGIFWIWETYIRGLPSWTWHYPHHHAPSVSDFRDLPSLSVEFELGKPLTHFQQLLALTPATDAWNLPEAYQWLVTSPASPILDIYRLDFELDGEGKRKDWEAVCLLDVVDVPRILAAESEWCHPSVLSSEEMNRNQSGPVLHLRYKPMEWDADDSVFCESTIPTRLQGVLIAGSWIHEEEPIPLGSPGFLPKLVPGTSLSKHKKSGFPVLAMAGNFASGADVWIRFFKAEDQKSEPSLDSWLAKLRKQTQKSSYDVDDTFEYLAKAVCIDDDSDDGTAHRKPKKAVSQRWNSCGAMCDRYLDEGPRLVDDRPSHKGGGQGSCKTDSGAPMGRRAKRWPPLPPLSINIHTHLNQDMDWNLKKGVAC